ncbi:MAG: hypothetical protein AB8C46_09440 [Burkholderiaceae bacterium]
MDAALTPHFRDVQQCRFWLGRHLTEGEGLASALEQLAEVLDAQRQSSHSPVVLYQLVEVIRRALSGPSQRLIERVAGTAELPDEHTSLELAALDKVLDKLRLAALASDPTGNLNSPEDIRLALPGAKFDKKEALPLARALQLQSMRIIAMLRSRTVVPNHLWHELGDLAIAVRQTTFLDEKLSEDDDPDGNRTPRAWFVLPLLLRIAALEERMPSQAGLVFRLASTWSDRVGFRIDPNPVRKANKYGPTVKLGIEYRVRLDTHRLRDSMVRRQAKWLQRDRTGAVLPFLLSRVELADLLEDLFIRWSPAFRAPKMKAPPKSHVKMRFGLPSREVLMTCRAAARQKSPSYKYGQFQRNTVISPLRHEAKDESDGLEILEHGELGHWALGGHQTVVIDRHSRMNSPPIDGIVAFALERRTTEQNPPLIEEDDLPTLNKHLQLARVSSVQRLMGGDGSLAAQRLAMRTIDGIPTPVQIDRNDEGIELGAYLVAGEAADQPSLFVPPSTLKAGAQVLVRRPDDEVTVEVGSLLEAGPNYERYTVKPRGSAKL